MGDFPVVRVEWVDSCTIGDGRWLGETEWRDEPIEQCVTVGFLINETVDALYLAASLSGEEFGGVWVIPKCSVMRRVAFIDALASTGEVADGFA